MIISSMQGRIRTIKAMDPFPEERVQ